MFVIILVMSYCVWLLYIYIYVCASINLFELEFELNVGIFCISFCTIYWYGNEWYDKLFMKVLDMELTSNKSSGLLAPFVRCIISGIFVPLFTTDALVCIAKI